MILCITSVGTATSIGLIKYIRKYDKNIRIIGTDINEYGYTAGSMLVDKFYRVSLAKHRLFFNEILDIIEIEKTDVIIPINDNEIEVFSRNYSRLSKKTKCLVPKVNVIKLVRDKLSCTLKMEDIGLKCPKRIDINSEKKCIIRDRIGVGSKNVKILNNENFLGSILENQFIQEFISGIEYTVDVLCDEMGKPLYIIPRQRLEVKAGVATKVKFIKDMELIRSVENVLRIIKLPGFSNFQFIVDEEGNQYFIEINPRFGGCSSSSLLAAPGMFNSFMRILSGDINNDIDLNENLKDVKWNSVVTRFYEEVIYEYR